MTILAWIIMGAAVVGILCVLFGVYCVIRGILQSRKLKKLFQRPPKNKKKTQEMEDRTSQVAEATEEVLCLGHSVIRISNRLWGSGRLCELLSIH